MLIIAPGVYTYCARTSYLHLHYLLTVTYCQTHPVYVQIARIPEIRDWEIRPRPALSPACVSILYTGYAIQTLTDVGVFVNFDSAVFGTASPASET